MAQDSNGQDLRVRLEELRLLLSHLCCDRLRLHVGHNYIGHTCTGHNYILGHKYIRMAY